MNGTRKLLLLTLACVLGLQAQVETYIPNILRVRNGGGNLGVWKKFRITVDATNWLVNGAVAMARSGTWDAPVLFTLPAGGMVEKTAQQIVTPCSLNGVATATAIVANSTGQAFGATSYNLAAAAGPTNFLDQTPAVSRYTTAADSVVYLPSVTGGTTDQLTGCVIDAWVKWSVLP